MDITIHTQGDPNKLDEDMQNVVFWDVAPCGSCRSRRFRGTYRRHMKQCWTGLL
jgi:hypothetical protein